MTPGPLEKGALWPHPYRPNECAQCAPFQARKSSRDSRESVARVSRTLRRTPCRPPSAPPCRPISPQVSRRTPAESAPPQYLRGSQCAVSTAISRETAASKPLAKPKQADSNLLTHQGVPVNTPPIPAGPPAQDEAERAQ